MNRLLTRNTGAALGALFLALLVILTIAAPYIAGDPLTVAPAARLRPPGPEAWFGTDYLGRDIFARAVYGARISLTVGFSVAVLSIIAGMAIGIAAGYWRWLDRPLMGVMEGVMAIPSILLAIALVALNKPGLGIVTIAIAIPEIPRVARLVRSIILSTRELPYVEAAVASGVRTHNIITYHIIPSTLAPLVVQGTYIVASGILIEASLSFLGAGVPPEVPTWGNMIASNRLYIAIAPWSILVPGALLAAVILSVNLIGDALRDKLDVKMGGRK